MDGGLSEYALSEQPISGDGVEAWTGLDYWVVIDGELELQVKIDTFEVEDTQGGNSNARFTLLNPSRLPLAGQTVYMIWQDEQLFGGQITSVKLEQEPSHAVQVYSCEAVGWMRLLERKIINAEYANLPFSDIFDDVWTNYLTAEGITKGVIDDGPELILAKGEYIRISEFLRDVAEGSGGIVYIDPYKALQFRKTSIDSAPFILRNADVLDVDTEEDLDLYCNKLIVKVDGVSSGVTPNIVTRQDQAEIAARQALEGGTGIYESYASIKHPTSDDSVQLERLGISYAYIKLAATGRVRKTFRARILRPELRLGQVIEVDLPDFALSGSWQIVRLRAFDEGGYLFFEFDAQLTNFQQLALNSLLSIVQAGRATVILPLAQFANLDTISASGDYTVPGTPGTLTDLEITSYGAGGGGGGSFDDIPGVPASGAKGGNGGKVVSFRQILAGTILTVRIGTGGAGGQGGNNSACVNIGAPFCPLGGATASGITDVQEAGVLICRADGGIGGQESNIFRIAQAGAPGGGQGDYIYPGDGAAGGRGGIGGTADNDGANGQNGYVEIRY